MEHQNAGLKLYTNHRTADRRTRPPDPDPTGPAEGQIINLDGFMVRAQHNCLIYGRLIVFKVEVESV